MPLQSTVCIYMIFFTFKLGLCANCCVCLYVCVYMCECVYTQMSAGTHWGQQRESYPPGAKETTVSWSGY